MYLERLCAALAENADVEPLQTANERRRRPAGGGAGSLANAAGDGVWTALALPRQARKTGAAVIHHPLPAWSPGFRGAQVVTVHDLAFELFPEDFARSYRRYAHLAHRGAARRADAVIAVSQATASDIAIRWLLDPDRIIVAPHGPGQALSTTAAGDQVAPTHFLYVGDDEPRKDLPTLLRAYRQYRARVAGDPLGLVLAGAIERTTGLTSPGVSFELGVSRERLARLHLGAAALVHPARHEGFGLTVLEALASGTPVIAADTAAVREVAADAADYFKPGDDDALVRLLELRATHRPDGTAARQRAARFSWAASARAHAAAYSLAVENAAKRTR